MLSKPELTLLSAFLFVILCHASPINRQAGGQNTLRLDVRNQSYTEQNVCVNDDVLYQPGDLMPAPSPCQRCVCRPPGSQCAPVACEKRPGCKSVLRPDQCCPEYQCECERNGRRYANGERLDNAETPCQACYCQGGEVVCTTVECYKREDCEPQYVEGKCCPKYDHCPPLVMDDARFAEPPPVAEKVRPHHTRSTFQPGAGAAAADDDDDQTPGASNVDERIEAPDVTASPSTGNGQRDEGPPSTDTRVHSQHLDAAVPTIKIQIPAIPWSEQSRETTLAPEQQDGSGDDAETQTLPASDDQGSGAAETEIPSVKTRDEGLIGVIEHITETVKKDNGEDLTATDQIVTDITTDRQEDTLSVESFQGSKQEDVTTIKVQDVTGATRAETEPNTVSSEYTDIPEEMITTESNSGPKDVTEIQGLDLTTDALLEATTTVKDASQSIESSTDSSPEFKDFDEWTGTKSTEFQRDSSSSSSPSDSHSKHSSVSSDESTSHFLATNINSEKVKLVPEIESNSEAVSSSTDSNESDITEGSATTDGSDNNSGNPQKTSEDNLSQQPQETNTEEQIQEHKRLSIDQLLLKTKDGHHTDNGQLNIVLDTEATDENGPPILLIGDELANHQMDIVVATVPSFKPESITDVPFKVKPETSSAEKMAEDGQKYQTEGPIETTTLEQAEATTSLLNPDIVDKESLIAKNAAQISKTEETTVLDSTLANIDISQTEIGITSSGNKDLNPSTENVGIRTDQEEVMLSDEPLPGQASGVDINEDNIQKIFDKTQEYIKEEKESEKLDDTKDESQETRLITSLPDADTTTSAGDVKLTTQFTETFEQEATTNIISKEEVGTTQDPQLESTINSNAVSAGQEKSNADRETDLAADHLDGIVNEHTTESVTDNPTTSGNLELESTLINTERIRIDLNIPSVFDEKEALKEDNESKKIGIKTAQQGSAKDSVNESEKQEEVTTEIPSTQVPFISKADKVKDFAHEEMLLGDQPQILDSSQQSFSAVDKQKKPQQEKTDVSLETTTEMNLESAIIHEEIHTDDSELESDSTHKVEEEISNDDLQDSDNEPTNEQREDQVNTTPSNKDLIESLEQTTLSQKDKIEQLAALEKAEVASVQSTQINEEEIALKSISAISEEQATPPPDTTQADAKEVTETTTNLSDTGVKSENGEKDTTEIVPGATTLVAVNRDQAEVSVTDRQEDTTNVAPKINPEVLELRPVLSTKAPNASEVPIEAEITTLPPQWLKRENETTEKLHQKDEVKEQDSSNLQLTDNPSQDIQVTNTNTEEAAAATTIQPPSLGDTGKHRLDDKQAVEDADKKDLFILEDFFTKLYRHQIATDATKH